MTWGWPQLTMLALFAISAGVHLAKHGETKDSHYHFGWDLIGTGFMAWLLYHGGFWTAPL